MPPGPCWAAFRASHIDGKSRIAFRCSPPCGSELLDGHCRTDIRLRPCRRKEGHCHRLALKITPDKLCRNFSVGLVGQLGTYTHIPPAFFRNGNARASLAVCLPWSLALGAFDAGRLVKHIRLVLQLPVLVQYLQRTQEIVRRIVRKGHSRFLSLRPQVFGGKRIIEPVQFPPFSFSE